MRGFGIVHGIVHGIASEGNARIGNDFFLIFGGERSPKPYVVARIQHPFVLDKAEAIGPAVRRRWRVCNLAASRGCRSGLQLRVVRLQQEPGMPRPGLIDGNCFCVCDNRDDLRHRRTVEIEREHKRARAYA